MRSLGVDLPTTNFVLCFLPEQGKVRVGPEVWTLLLEGRVVTRKDS
jgi:hypothetical protein